MGSLATVLVILAMIGGGVVLIHLANARHAGLPPLTSPDRWWHRRSSATAGGPGRRRPGEEPATDPPVHGRPVADRKSVPVVPRVHVPPPPSSPEVRDPQQPRAGTAG